MLRYITKYITILTLLLWAGDLSAQQEYTSRSLTTLNGLSQNNANDIIQDSEGYIWIATNDGLNRYDGLEFKIYNIGDLGLGDNLIVSLCEDNSGNIWLGTADKGLYCYVKDRNRFFHYSELIDCQQTCSLVTVAGIYRAPENRLWIIENRKSKYIQLEINNERITSFKEFGTHKGLGIRNAMTVANSTEYVGKGTALQYFDKQRDSLVVDDIIGNRYISGICSRGNTLIISTNKGLITYNPEEKSYKIHSNIITHSRNICWSGDRLWYASSFGLYYTQYNPKQQKFSRPVKVDTYQNLIINNIISDHAGGIWIAIARQGLRRYEINRHPFKKTSVNFENNVIQSLCITPQDEILVGTDSRGLYILDSLSASSARKHILERSPIADIIYDPSAERYFVSTGKYVYQCNSDFSDTPTPILEDASMRQLHIDGSNLWVSTYNYGLIRHNLTDGTTTRFTTDDKLPSNVVRSVMSDTKGNLWISTASGLAMIVADQKNALKPTITPILANTTQNQHILSTLQLQNGDIWYCTLGYGLFTISQNSKGEYLIGDNYTTKNGLSNNSIKSAIEDVTGNIWVSTNRGLSRIDSSKGEATTYDIFDGLNDYEFCEYATAQLSDGTLVFGSCNGINYINPRHISLDTTEAIPTITDFSLFDQSIYAQSDPKYITSSGDIKLNHDENTFTITFAALNFSNPEHAEFDYMLSGVDKDWNRAHNHSNRVTYKNLRPAEYTFLLRAANSSDIFSATVLKQRIVIEPPIWATWYAFLFYFLLLTLAAYVVVQYYSERLKRHEAMEISKMERRKIEELLEMRTLFFTNISHELRTPLTLILSPLQSLMRETQITSNTKWHGYLKTMQHNGNSLLRLINELLSHTKQESGKLKCEKHNGDIEATSRTLFMQFSFWAEQKSITLSFSSEQRPLYIDYDPYLMEQILYNLISNAMKNTPQNGDISFTLEDEGRNIVLSVSNSGAGISDEAKEHIFEHFFSLSSDSSREMGGSGVGLHLTKSLVELHHGEIWFTSQPDQRTTFYVRLPKPSTQQTELRAEASSPVNDSEATAQQQESQLQLSRLYGEDSNTLPSLLIIDDNIEMLKLLEDIFSQSYSITTACDGEQGWQTCLDEMPDIIISDVMMPKLNGLELLKRIKTDNRTSHIPIVLLTAKSGDEDIATGYRTQADGYCCKPFSNDVLLESVNSILRNRKLMATKYNLMQDDESQLESTISNADHLFLKRLSEYIEENIHSPELVVNSLCSYMGVTSLVLNKKLKSLINMTANALIRSIRLKRAATLLKTGRYTIADVTYDVGFSDLRYFRECFKKEFGILPQEYKERYSPPQQES